MKITEKNSGDMPQFSCATAAADSMPLKGGPVLDVR